MSFLDKWGDECNELVENVIDAQQIDWIDEGLINRVFGEYIYYKIRQIFWVYFYTFVIFIICVWVLLDESLTFNKPIRYILAIAGIKFISIMRMIVEDYIGRQFSETVVKMFKKNPDSWHQITQEEDEDNGRN